jgi:TRAP-type C4-dicarboxylate transport system permease large subunit
LLDEGGNCAGIGDLAQAVVRRWRRRLALANISASTLLAVLLFSSAAGG